MMTVMTLMTMMTTMTTMTTITAMTMMTMMTMRAMMTMMTVMTMMTMMTMRMVNLTKDADHDHLQEPFECKDIEKAILEIREQEVFLILIHHNFCRHVIINIISIIFIDFIMITSIILSFHGQVSPVSLIISQFDISYKQM